jgi:hypothetical protein
MLSTLNPKKTNSKETSNSQGVAESSNKFSQESEQRQPETPGSQIEQNDSGKASGESNKRFKRSESDKVSPQIVDTSTDVVPMSKSNSMEEGMVERVYETDTHYHMVRKPHSKGQNSRSGSGSQDDEFQLAKVDLYLRDTAATTLRTTSSGDQSEMLEREQENQELLQLTRISNDSAGSPRSGED